MINAEKCSAKYFGFIGGYSPHSCELDAGHMGMHSRGGFVWLTERLGPNGENEIVVNEAVRPGEVYIGGPAAPLERKPGEGQQGGSHYKSTTIDPWAYIEANGLGFFEGNILKYITRHRQKGGVEDLKKAQHYLERLIQIEQGKPK